MRRMTLTRARPRWSTPFVLIVLAISTTGAAPAAVAKPTAHATSSGPPTAQTARWCDTATIRIGGFPYWPYASPGMRCRIIIRRARAFVLHNRKPAGWKCRRYTGGEGQRYGSCYRGSRYFGVTIPH
jgi:hypothetical protein